MLSPLTELADTLVTIGSKAVQQITQPTAAPSTAASPPSALPTLHAAQEMLELAHEVRYAVLRLCVKLHVHGLICQLLLIKTLREVSGILCVKHIM